VSWDVVDTREHYDHDLPHRTFGWGGLATEDARHVNVLPEQRDGTILYSLTVKDPDGSITIHFGGDPEKPNFLPIIPGWNYIVRMYRPTQEILDGTWQFPAPSPVA
jgi:hypothetical protein